MIKVRRIVDSQRTAIIILLILNLLQLRQLKKMHLKIDEIEKKIGKINPAVEIAKQNEPFFLYLLLFAANLSFLELQ